MKKRGDCATIVTKQKFVYFVSKSSFSIAKELSQYSQKEKATRRESQTDDDVRKKIFTEQNTKSS